MMIPNTNLLFQGFIFRFHVSFRGMVHTKQRILENQQLPGWEMFWAHQFFEPPGWEMWVATSGVDGEDAKDDC